MTYEFKGYIWNELAECWGLEADEDMPFIDTVKKHIWESLDGDYKFKDPQMRTDIVAFLTKLADVEEPIGYRAPAFRGIAAIEADYTLTDWVTRNLEELWT